MIRLKEIGLALTLLLFVSACGGSTDHSNENASADVELSGTDYLITIKTVLGEMKAVLFDDTPQHKANFLKLVREGYYDSLAFHRVIEGFMVHGGDPESKNAGPSTPLGTGGPGYTIPAEFNDKFFHRKGALSAARQPDNVNPEKASNGSQFYLVQGQVIDETNMGQFSGVNRAAIGEAFQELRNNYPDHELNERFQAAYEEGGDQAVNDVVMESLDELSSLTGIVLTQPEMEEYKKEDYMTVGGTPFLDGDYTVFGQVIDGLDIIDAIAAVQTGPGDRPVDDVRMYMSVEELPRQKIYEKYGYDFNIQ